MFEIPTSLKVGEEVLHLRNDGDYRTILDCVNALGDAELDVKERIIASLLIFYDGMTDVLDLNRLDIEAAVKQMYWFLNCGQSESPGMKVNHKVIDWQQDSQLICSAINKVANTEIRSVPYMHWWTFIGYYLAVGESALSTVVGIRSKMLRGKPLDKAEKEFKRNNPEYFTWNSKTVEQQEADELVKSLWNSERR